MVTGESTEWRLDLIQRFCFSSVNRFRSVEEESINQLPSHYPSITSHKIYYVKSRVCCYESGSGCLVSGGGLIVAGMGWDESFLASVGTADRCCPADDLLLVPLLLAVRKMIPRWVPPRSLYRNYFRRGLVGVLSRARLSGRRTRVPHAVLL